MTNEGRCIAFPNTYQHQVSSFELVDKTKPGHRKIVALFLVDPTLGQPLPMKPDSAPTAPIKVQPKIPSTSIIPPQQSHWTRAALNVDSIHPSNPFHKMPAELIEAVASQLETPNEGALMTMEEAKAYRLMLMDERTVFVDAHDENCFVTEFNMCEH